VLLEDLLGNAVKAFVVVDDQNCPSHVDSVTASPGIGNRVNPTVARDCARVEMRLPMRGAGASWGFPHPATEDYSGPLCSCLPLRGTRGEARLKS
jgi:hypothetical protein